MTLINYLSRIHFADGILEDALHSEVERNMFSRPLIVCEAGIVDTEIFDRLISGFPYRSQVTRFEIPADQPKNSLNSNLKDQCTAHGTDVIVAFGSADIIGCASQVHTAARQLRPHFSAAKFAPDTGYAPGFFAIPGVEGLANCTCHPQLSLNEVPPFHGEQVHPDVIICDPTLTLGETREKTSSSAVLTMTRCIEAFISDTFNPPADAIALDGLLRTAQNLHQTLATESLAGRRELMAAALNGMLAQQKNTGIVQALIESLAMEANKKIDEGAIARLLLPVALELQAGSQPNSRHDQIKTTLGVPAHIPLHDGVRTFLRELPLPSSLSELGLTKAIIQNTIRSTNMLWGPDTINEKTLMLLMMSEPY